MMTQQEIFNKAYAHALTMKAMARDDSLNTAQCMYRAPNGEKCLIGSFIPDNKYTPEMERVIFDLVTDTRFRPILNEIGLITAAEDDDFSSSIDYKDDELEFLNSLQNCHDNADTLEDMFTNLRQFAKDYKLQMPPEQS